ncbi:ABC transporter substrate-binding protein [Brachybacterium sp. DNPG3]
MTIQLPSRRSGLHLPSRRNVLGLGALGAGLGALAACGGPSVGGSDSSDSGSSAAEEIDYSSIEPATEIDFWTNHPGGSKDVEAELIAKFTEETGITVNHVTAGSNYEEIAQRFQTAQAANSGLPAAVVLSDVWWFRYFINGNIVALDPLIDQIGIEVDDYRDALVADYQYDGKQWALPYGRSTPLFYYNKQHFADAGLEDRAPESWEEFEEWAPQLTQGQTAYMYPDLAGYAGWTLQNVLWGRGTAWSDEWTLTVNAQETIDAMQWVQDSIYDSAWGEVASSDSADTFAAGVCSTTIASTGSLVGVLEAADFEVGVGFLPAGPVDGPVCPTGGAGLGIPSAITPEEQLAGAMLIEYMGRPESTVAFSGATGYMPLRKSADISELLATTPQIQTAIDQLEVTRTQDYARVFLPGADQEMANAVAGFATSQGDVAESLNALQETLEGIYTKEVEPKL